jgi:hypothetical protein
MEGLCILEEDPKSQHHRLGASLEPLQLLLMTKVKDHQPAERWPVQLAVKLMTF